jgi:large subunit ribosomal protein L29
MPIGSKDLAIEKLEKLEDSALTAELKKAKEELFNLRFQSATGQLASNARVRAVKRDIARIYTIIRERELGIRTKHDAEESAAPKASKSKKKAVKADEEAQA